MKIFSFLLFVLMTTPVLANSYAHIDRVYQNVEPVASINPHVALSMELLESIKKHDTNQTDKVLKQIAEIPFDELVNSLDTKQKKLAFWMNIYNAFVQIELIADPKLFENKGPFYSDKRHWVAGLNLSYDNIEHGIIRNSRAKYSLGYFKRLGVKKWERRLRNKDIDGRVHFALNCGAISCPPVAVYNDLEIEEQLDKVNRIYLKENTTIEGKNLNTTPLFSWFRGDFGGKKEVKKFLMQYEAIPKDKTKYNLKFNPYDWTLLTENYIDL